ncbi:hypothetical protein EVAR_85879_1 [Eumeta japonica]|uniref:Endonuclease/exonuclease/phosphatase domain-containing protein n=1 Tax=Eumeta variegata TaxID=151549 RepID=A0A4C2A6R5_EUMVA|nr:hypothetical protein EVAR_85879_1 [Eumeta japonica]
MQELLGERDQTEANHEAFSNKCKKWTQNDSDDSSESPEIQSSDCRVTPAGDRERDIDSSLVQEPYVGNQGILKQNPGTKVIQCTVGRQKPVKAAIIVFGDKVENEKACKNLGTENLIIAGDINAWSHWWEAREKTGGPSLQISWTKWASTSSTQEALPPSRPIGR